MDKWLSLAWAVLYSVAPHEENQSCLNARFAGPPVRVFVTVNAPPAAIPCAPPSRAASAATVAAPVTSSSVAPGDTSIGHVARKTPRRHVDPATHARRECQLSAKVLRPGGAVRSDRATGGGRQRTASGAGLASGIWWSSLGGVRIDVDGSRGRGRIHAPGIPRGRQLFRVPLERAALQTLHQHLRRHEVDHARHLPPYIVTIARFPFG